MSGETERVEVVVKLPKPVVDFVRKLTDLVGDSFNEFVESAVVGAVNSMVANEEIFDTPWTCTINVIDKNKLRPFIDENYLKHIKRDC